MSRIRGSIETSAPVQLRGNVSIHAQPQFDRGAVESSLPLTDMALVFKPSADQQADLDRFLAEQQDPTSPNYHRWLTPEQYGDRFGPSQPDLEKIDAWLTKEGFQVSYRARSRNWIAFSGTARQVARSFHTAIHRYVVDGEEHFANATEPFIPAALDGLVSSLRGLDDFRLKPMHHQYPGVNAVQPEYTSGSNHFLAPDDIASIYNLNPLYSAGFDGSGQKLAIVGQTNITQADVAAFRSIFSLPAKAPQMVLYGRDPGIVSGDQQEAELDLEWSGAVARNATLIYVYSTNVFSSLQYAVDQNLAPVISMSYGGCESGNASILDTYRTIAQQAATQGISWLASSGDSGAAGCDFNTSRASNGKAVEFPASIPEVTAVGGTEFNEGTGSYWSASNGTNQGSATGYIPEKAWNDSSSSLSATGGGVSGHFPTPAWQTGAGFPNDGHRDVPDVSLTASAAHDGFIVCTTTTACPANWRTLGVGSGYAVYGGTSVSSPALAGILTVLNQYLVSKGVQTTPGVGSANPTLYLLAQTSPSAFHDVTVGNNIVTCRTGTTGCTTGSFGYSAGTGYDQATGLGSIDAYNLVTAWAGVGGPQIASISPALPIVSAIGQTIVVTGSGFVSGLTASMTSPAGVATTLQAQSISASSFQISPVLSLAGTWKLQVTQPDGRQSGLFNFTVNPALAVPAVTAVAASALSGSSATLNGLVTPAGGSTTVWFLYGTASDLSGGSTTVAQNIGSGYNAVNVSASLSGLAAGATYYFQVWASNSAGTSRSGILSFTSVGTSAVPSSPAGLNPLSGAVGISSSPTLSWSPSANATGYTVYFGSSYPPTNSVTLSGANNTSYSPGLMNGLTTYYWQVVATSAAGTASSGVFSFSTGTLVMPATKVGIFRSGSSALLDSNGNGVYDPSTDRFIASFTGPGGYLAGDVGVSGDWTGDGRSKVGVYRSTTGAWYLDVNNDGVYDAGDLTYQFGGLSGDVPVVGDWNGVTGASTFKQCIGIYRSQGSVWLLDLNCNGVFENTPLDAFFPFGGLAGDVPVVGNWTGGRTRVGVVRKYAPGGVPQGEPFFWVFDSADANAGNLALDHQPATGAFAFGGLPGDIYVTGDWNGSGAAKAGIFRSSAAGVQPFQWVLDANGRHTPDIAFNLYGATGDSAITGKW